MWSFLSSCLSVVGLARRVVIATLFSDLLMRRMVYMLPRELLVAEAQGRIGCKRQGTGYVGLLSCQA